MFNKKMKEELTDQLATYQERGAPRWGKPNYDIDGGITITGFEGEGQVGNVSISGCSLMSVTYVNIIPDKIYQVKITPGKSDKVEPFNLKLKLSWTKSSETIFYAGFSLCEGENNAPLKRYIEALSSRGIKPDFGNMDTKNQTS